MHLYGRNPPTFSGQQHLWRFLSLWHLSGDIRYRRDPYQRNPGMRKIRQCCLPILFYSSRSQNLFGCRRHHRPDRTIPDKARKWWGRLHQRWNKNATVRTSVGNILFHNSIVEKMQKLCYNASACFTKTRAYSRRKEKETYVIHN